MKQKLKLKSKCFQCGNTKWCIDFKEHSYNKINRRSICQFCELEKLIRKQSVEIIALKQQLKQQEESSNTNYAETVKMIADSQAEYQHLKHDITENAKKITTFESEWKNFKECKNYDAKKINMNLSAVERQCTNSEEQLKSEEQFRVVSKRKTAKPSPSVAIPQITTENRFEILATKDDEDEVDDEINIEQIERKRSIIGKSSTERLIRKVEILKTNGNIVVQPEGDQLFLQNGETGDTEPIVKELKMLVDTLSKKTKKAAIIGILPGRQRRYALSKALGINRRIEVECERINKIRKDRKIIYIDLWSEFVEKRAYFTSLGKLSKLGKKRYAEVLKEKLNGLSIRNARVVQDEDDDDYDYDNGLPTEATNGEITNEANVPERATEEQGGNSKKENGENSNTSPRSSDSSSGNHAAVANNSRDSQNTEGNKNSNSIESNKDEQLALLENISTKENPPPQINNLTKDIRQVDSEIPKSRENEIDVNREGRTLETTYQEQTPEQREMPCLEEQNRERGRNENQNSSTTHINEETNARMVDAIHQLVENERNNVQNAEPSTQHNTQGNENAEVEIPPE